MPLQTAERLALQHQRDLATIAGGVTSVVATTALGGDPAAISTWYFGVVDGLLARIQAGHAQARRSSTEFLRKHAAMNGVDLTPVPASLDMTRARTSLRVTGPVAFKTAIASGLDEDQALRSMATQMAGSSQRLVLAGDRDTFEQTLLGDKGIIGWRRRLAGKSCGFCAMLASRGAVYVTRKSASVGRDGLAFHDHCHCWPEPMYSHEQEPADVRKLQRQWNRVTAGTSGRDARVAWRNHWENRATPAGRERMGLAASTSSPTPGLGGAVPQLPTIRPLLASAKSTAEVERILTAEMQRLTGQRPAVVLTGMSSETAREVGEGILRGVERFPQADLRQVVTYAHRDPTLYAQHDSTLGAIEFNEHRASLRGRESALQMLAKDTSGDIPWHPRGTGNWTGIAVHEFGHAVDIGTVGQRIRSQVDALLVRRAAERDADLAARRAARELIEPEDFIAGGGVDGLIRREISEYATRDGKELIAEAFADVLMNGPAASQLSREVFDLLEAEYRKGGRRIGIPGVVSPSEVGDLSKLTVPQLRALAKERGVTVPAKALKRDIVAALEGEPAKLPVPAPVALSKMKVADLRAMAAEQKLTLPPKATKAQIVEALQMTPAQRQAAARAAASLSGKQVQTATKLGRLTEAELKAVDRYGGDGSYVINADLRDRSGRLDLLTDRNRQTVETLDAIFGRSVLPQDAILYRRADLTRGPWGDLANNDHDLTGLVWTEHAYSSTSIAERLEGGRSVQIRIFAPKGTRAFSHRVLDSDEVLLDRGTTFRVIADRGKDSRFNRVIDVEIVPKAPPMAAELRRIAARERNRLIEQATGTESLLAHLDEIIAKGADAKVIRQALDAKLITPEQVFGNADPQVLAALRAAFADGDVAKLKAAITRASTKTKLKPVGGKAGAKVKFDPDVMEAIGGGDIAAGVQVQVVTRGASLTLPDGTTIQLRKAQVAPVPAKEKPLLGRPITRRQLEIAKAKREIPKLEARLRALPAGSPERANAEYLLDNARAVVDQKPGRTGYNWSSPTWDDPAASRILRPPTKAELEAQIDAGLSTALPAPMRREMGQELARQGDVTPRSMLEFRGITDPSTFHHTTHPNAYAYYDATFQQVTFHPRWVSDGTAIRTSYANDISTGWHPPTSRSVLDATLAHEYGHHLTYRMFRETAAVQRKMIQLIDDQLGMGGFLVREFRKNPDLEAVINDFLKGPYGVGRVQRAVSRYAQKSAQEFFAEVWSEYTTSSNPRAQIQAIGDMMKLMAETSDVVLK